MRSGSSRVLRIKKEPMLVFRNFLHDVTQLCSSTMDMVCACEVLGGSFSWRILRASTHCDRSYSLDKKMENVLPDLEET